MEKLRKALEKARHEREAAASRSGEPPAAAATPGRPPPDAGSYEFTQSRVVTPDPAHLERHRVLTAEAASPVADAYRMLRTQVLQRMQEHGWRTLSIVSASRGDGRTLAAANLAVMLAADPRYSVLLCDLDLRSPGVAPLFGFPVDRGVDDVLAGRASVAECLVHPSGYERLVLLPARAPLARSSEFLASAATVDLVGELRDRYPDRILIFDLPPVLSADDALAFTPLTDCALMVVAEGSTRREDVARTLEILQHTPVVGTVLNRSLAGNDVAA